MTEEWFAWYPVHSDSKGWLWLCAVIRQWDDSLNSWGDSSGYSGTDGGWKYL